MGKPLYEWSSIIIDDKFGEVDDAIGKCLTLQEIGRGGCSGREDIGQNGISDKFD